MWKISLVYGGPSIPIKKKIKAKNKYKINKKINEMKLFFFKIKKGEKNTGFKKTPKNQMYIDSLLAKWQPQPNFQQKNPYRYKRTRREHLTSNQPLKFTRCHRGVKVVPNKGRLDAIAVSSYLWNHQILKHPKTTKKKKKMVGSWMFAQHRLLGIPAGSQLLLLLQFDNLRLSRAHYKNHNSFFSLVPGGKEKRSFFKMVIFQHEARSQGPASKTTIFSGTTWKLSSTVPTFNFSVNSSSGC